MKVHYVDDDDADLILMIEATRSFPEILVSTSKSIDGLLDRIRLDHLDCVLLDINRPDAHSLEDDIETISEHCNLPIILVTGTVEDDTRLRATLAGADGVIDKSALSKELLEQVLKNARARVLAKITEGVFVTTAEVKTSTQSVPDWYEEVLRQLYKVETSIEPSVDAQALSYIFDLQEAINAAKRDQKDNRSISACVPMRWVLKAAIDATHPFAIEQKVTVLSGTVEGTFFPKGSREIGYLGLQLLLHGVIAALQQGQTLSLSATQNKNNKSTIVLSISEQVFLSTDEFFGVRNLRDVDADVTNAYLKLATIALGLSHNDIVIGASLNHQLISVDLQDVEKGWTMFAN